MIANLEEKTGKSLADWIAIGQKSGLDKHHALLSHLKDDHRLTHGYANLIVLFCYNSCETYNPHPTLQQNISNLIHTRL